MLGIIADDVTGATDIASRLVEAGCRTILTFGVPTIQPPSADAIVIATKSRMDTAAAACRVALEGADYLEQAGARQFYFKYCSTFDSTDDGNIGPVTDALMARLDVDFTLIAPAYPALRRTTYLGHLFVMDRLLSESSMRDHPLTPMRDPDLVRVLGRQTQSKIGLVPFVAVDAGVEQTCAAIKKLQAESVRMAVLDAVLDRHIDSAAIACREMRLVTGGAALGGALGAIGHASGAGLIAANRPAEGAIAFLSGSCSTMTRAQVAALVAHVPSFMIDPLALAADAGMVGDIIDWAIEQAKRGDFLVYSTVDPTGLEAIQEQLGRGPAAASLENAFGRIARALAEAGTRKFVVAGGETSGAVTQALGVQMMTFGEELAPGVPRAFTLEPEGFLLVLKSGNFGETDFFLRARGAL